MSAPLPRQLWLRFPHFLSFGFGSGLAPWAPGTFGTAVAIPLYLLLQLLPAMTYLMVVAAAFAFGVWCCNATARALGVHDHQAIVWDEVVGYWVTMTLAPPGWLWLLLGFALFRLFDILKPWPIVWVDRKVAGGLGIMLDDLLAGIIGAVVLQVVVRLV